MDLTVKTLYLYARKNNLLDAPLRICDGMAVSFYPTPACLVRGRYETVIDISHVQPIEYDELDAWRLAQSDPEE